MPPVARYAKAVAKPGQGDALAAVLLEVTEGVRSAPGCELYVVNRVPGEPETLWVTELWRDQAALDAAVPDRSDPLVERVMALVESFDRIDLEPAGGVGLADPPRPGFTVLHLPDAPDRAAGFGLGDLGEARFPREELGVERTGLNLQSLKPGKRQSFGHHHANAEEVYVVLSGSGTVRVGHEQAAVGPMDAIRIHPELNRALEAGPDGLEWLAVGPRHAGEAAMEPGWWGD